MRRIKLTVAYDGTAYRGWQLQLEGRTVEGELNRAVSELTGEDIKVVGASRTDSGVHAEGNVAVFDTESRIPGEKFAYAINSRLPEDIRVIDSEETEPSFHPRKVPCIKTYRYRIYSGRIENPLSRLCAHFCYYPLNIEDMKKAAEYLLGEHDFTSFANPDSQALLGGGSAVRTIYSAEISVEHEKSGDAERGHYGIIDIVVRGNGFLYNMVRIIVGTLLMAGTGHYKPEDMKRILEARDRRAAGPTAPARGLTLLRLDYEKEEENYRENRE